MQASGFQRDTKEELSDSWHCAGTMVPRQRPDHRGGQRRSRLAAGLSYQSAGRVSGWGVRAGEEVGVGKAASTGNTRNVPVSGCLPWTPAFSVLLRILKNPLASAGPNGALFLPPEKALFLEAPGASKLPRSKDTEGSGSLCRKPPSMRGTDGHSCPQTSMPSSQEPTVSAERKAGSRGGTWGRMGECQPAGFWPSSTPSLP